LHPAQLEPVDLLYLALPHGEAQQKIEEYAALGPPQYIDLSADFPSERRRFLCAICTAHAHAAPAWLGKSFYGLPEITP
jgi:N-acetyl-gamma-glutamyl-phosphate/LysW-gamma-L-alpha-aminoadipyl-6-phosphate reductase